MPPPVVAIALDIIAELADCRVRHGPFVQGKIDRLCLRWFLAALGITGRLIGGFDDSVARQNAGVC